MGVDRATGGHAPTTFLIGRNNIYLSPFLLVVKICFYTKDGATVMSRMNLSGYVGHVTILVEMFTVACCLVVGLGLGLGSGLDFVCG